MSRNRRILKRVYSEHISGNKNVPKNMLDKFLTHSFEYHSSEFSNKKEYSQRYECKKCNMMIDWININIDQNIDQNVDISWFPSCDQEKMDNALK